jgi:hypothetical protein
MTANRITKGRVRPGTAIAKVRNISEAGARSTAPISDVRERHQANPYEYFGVYDVVRLDTWLDK